MILGALLTLQTHVLLLVCVCQTILQDTVNKRLISKLRTSPHVGKVVGSVGHALGTGGHDDVRIASHDGLGTDNQCLDRGGADLVDGGCNSRLGETGANGTLAGGVLAKAVIVSQSVDLDVIRSAHSLRRKDVAYEDLLDILRLETSAVDGSWKERLVFFLVFENPRI